MGLSYEYDSISSLSSFYGYKHALQDFQPLPNKLVAAKAGRSMARVPAASASDLPKADLFQTLFSAVAAGGRFVNHEICCYSSQSNESCALQYNQLSIGLVAISCWHLGLPRLDLPQHFLATTCLMLV